MNDILIQDFLVKQLNYWKERKWNLNDIRDYFNLNQKKKRLMYVKINNGNIKYTTAIGGERFVAIKKLLNDIASANKTLNVAILVSLSDEVYDTDIEVYDLRNNENKVDDPNKHPFKWGISQKNNNIIRIENSKQTHFNFPIFSFSKTSYQKEVIIMPCPNLIKNSFYNDNISFEIKKHTPIFRFSNIRANLYLPTRFKLLELCYNNPDIIDCKGGYKSKHPGHGDYIIHPTFIKLYKKLNIINKSIDINKFKNLVRVENYMDKNNIINHKYLICGDSWYNSVDYALSNSVLLRYKMDKSKFYEDYIFKDNEDYIIFDENNYIEKYNYITGHNTKMLNMIENRKKKVENYLRYNKLVEHYGLLLQKFSEIQQKNEQIVII